jgi:hypothetical protein
MIAPGVDVNMQGRGLAFLITLAREWAATNIYNIINDDLSHVGKIGSA